MPACDAPLSDATLLDYWARDLKDAEVEGVEEHLFACGACSARLEQLAALGNGLATLVREGRVAGIVSRAILNRLQRDGVRVRTFSLAPGETVPCAVFPGDDVVIAAMRADFAGVDAVTLSVTGPGGAPFGQFEDIPVSGQNDEVLWANPASFIQQLPSLRLELTVTAAGAEGAELGRYVLEHTAQAQPR